jgi:hypothetical protein
MIGPTIAAGSLRVGGLEPPVEVTLTIAGSDLHRLAKRLVDAHVVAQVQVQEHVLPALVKRFVESLAEQIRSRGIEATWNGTIEPHPTPEVRPTGRRGVPDSVPETITIEFDVPVEKLSLRLDIVVVPSESANGVSR